MTNLLFPALLKFWRGRRGMSQLDLALEADVSARHLSFLESGRARPSEEVALRLLACLGVPLRNQNEALRAAGYQPQFPEAPLAELGADIDAALSQMMAEHEPYPLTVLAVDGSVLRLNRGAAKLFRAFSCEPLPDEIDMLSLVLDRRYLRPFVIDWEVLARKMLSRMHRLHLARGGDDRIAAMLERVMTTAGIAPELRRPDFTIQTTPTLTVRLRRGERAVAFLVTATTFSAPQAVALDELTIESSFPLDDATRSACHALAE